VTLFVALETGMNTLQLVNGLMTSSLLTWHGTKFHFLVLWQLLIIIEYLAF